VLFRLFFCLTGLSRVYLRNQAAREYESMRRMAYVGTRRILKGIKSLRVEPGALVLEVEG